MFVYLDESGDCGFKFRQGSSRYFVVALLLVDDPIPLHSEIEDLKRRLGFSPQTEFKFSHCAYDVKVTFLRAISRHQHWIRALVVDKQLISDPIRRERNGSPIDHIREQQLFAIGGS